MKSEIKQSKLEDARRQLNNCSLLSSQISAVPSLCYIVTRRLVESLGGVFDPNVSLATAVDAESPFGAAVSERDITKSISHMHYS